MGICRSQKDTNADNMIKNALNKLSSGKFQSVNVAARANNVPHSTLL